jgi:hypothetical protein
MLIFRTKNWLVKRLNKCYQLNCYCQICISGQLKERTSLWIFAVSYYTLKHICNNLGIIWRTWSYVTGTRWHSHGRDWADVFHVTGLSGRIKAVAPHVEWLCAFSTGRHHRLKDFHRLSGKMLDEVVKVQGVHFKTQSKFHFVILQYNKTWNTVHKRC